MSTLIERSKLLEIMCNQKFLDSSIGSNRYKRKELRNYLQFCCTHSNYIEAYSLTLQYVNDLIISFIDNGHEINDTEAGTIAKTLTAVGLIEPAL